MMTNERTELETFLIDNPELERLEALLEQFNIFEVLGAVRQEVRHSEFLAFLLNPQESHGLGDDFVRRLLQGILSEVDSSELPVTAIDLALWSLDDLEVRREWQNIDILLLSESNQLAVIIENKVGSKEHSNQLQRYWQIVDQHFSGWRVLGLFLTPEGDEPSDENYLSVSYERVCELLENLTALRQASLGPDVRTLIEHYTRMLRRHIVSGSEIEELCRKIYRKHQKALDLIYEYKPDLQAEIQDFLVELIGQTPGLEIDRNTKSSISFGIPEWDVPLLMQSEGWTKTGRMLLFEFRNDPNHLRLRLIMGPGPSSLRQKFYDLILEDHPPLKSYSKSLSKQFHTIYGHSFVRTKDNDNIDLEELKEKIKRVWDDFLNGDLEKIKATFKAQSWIWEE